MRPRLNKARWFSRTFFLNPSLLLFLCAFCTSNVSRTKFARSERKITQEKKLKINLYSIISKHKNQPIFYNFRTQFTEGLSPCFYFHFFLVISDAKEGKATITSLWIILGCILLPNLSFWADNFSTDHLFFEFYPKKLLASPLPAAGALLGLEQSLSEVSVLSNLLQLTWFHLLVDLTRCLLFLILPRVCKAEIKALLLLALKTSPKTFWAVSSSVHSPHQWQTETLPW